MANPLLMNFGLRQKNIEKPVFSEKHAETCLSKVLSRQDISNISNAFYSNPCLQEIFQPLQFNSCDNIGGGPLPSN